MYRHTSINLNRISNGIKRNTTELLPLICAVQLICIVLVNYFFAEKGLDTDSAVAVRHCVEMWRKKTLLLEDFHCATSLETDCPAFFAGLIYLITGNLGLGLCIAHAVMYCVVTAVLLDIFQNLGWSRKCGFLAAVLIFTPYANGQLDWANMVFYIAGQYEFRLLTMFLLIDVLSLPEEACRNKKRLLVILSMACTLWTSFSCGNFVLLLIVCPIVLGRILSDINGGILTVRKSCFFACFGNLATAFAGWLLNRALAGDGIRNSLDLIAADKFIHNLGNQITGVLLLFSGLTTKSAVPVFSFESIYHLTRFVFLIVVFAMVFALIRKTDNRSRFLLVCMYCVFAVTISVMMHADTLYSNPICEYRYHILWATLMLASIGCYSDESCSIRNGNLLLSILIVLLVIVNASGFFKIAMARNKEVEYSKAVVSKAEECDCNAVILYNRTKESRCVRGLDTNINCISMTYDGDFKYSTYDDYADATDRIYSSRIVMLIIDEQNFAGLPDDYTCNFMLKSALPGGEMVYISK